MMMRMIIMMMNDGDVYFNKSKRVGFRFQTLARRGTLIMRSDDNDDDDE
jgi:hypothetical protein